MRFFYDDSYDMGLSMVLCKVLYDDHTNYLGIKQDQTSMSLWDQTMESKIERSVSFVKS